MDEGEVQAEFLWDNRYILVQQKPISWTAWRNAGILYVNDLIHEELPRFMSHSELQDKYGIDVSFLELLQLRSAMPILWKRKIVSSANKDLSVKPAIHTIEGKPIYITTKSSKTIYYTIVRCLKPSISSQTKWNDVFPTDPQDRQEYWAFRYKSPYKAARDTKLQAFYFRIVHRFVPCNRFLKNIHILRDDKCSFCPDADTIEHFLFNCPIVQVFWRELIAWMEREANLQLSISLRAFLFGVPDELTQSKVINFILLFTKFFIYRQKLFHQGSLILIHFLRELRLRLQVEKYITTIEGKPSHFNQWKRMYTALGLGISDYR